MLNDLKIGAKITLLLLAAVLIAVFAISISSYWVSKNSIEARYGESLKVIANLKAEHLKNTFSRLDDNISSLQSWENVLEVLKQNRPDSLRDVAYFDSIASVLDERIIPIRTLNKYKDIVLLDSTGSILYAADKSGLTKPGSVYSRFAETERAKSKIRFGDPYESGDRIYMNVSVPLLSSYGTAVGFAVAEFDMEAVYQITDDTTGLRHTGEVLIGKLSESGGSVNLFNKFRNEGIEGRLNKSITLNDKNGEAMQKAAQGFEGEGVSLDYHGRTTFSEWRFLPDVGWGLVVKIDQSEINKELDFLIKTFIYAGLFVIFVSWAAARLYSGLLISPLLSLKAILSVVSKGTLPEKIEVNTGDEIGEMAVAVEEMIGNLKRTADFAFNIGQGDFDSPFSPAGPDDTLGNALLDMRDSIRNADKRDNERNWIVSGVAETGQILRMHTDLEDLSYRITEYVSEKIEAVQAAFYITEDTDVPQREMKLQMQACYAYGRKKFIKNEFRFAEGLIGQAAAEKDIILRTEIPAGYMRISSGLLGDRKPTCILIVPLIADDKSYGVLEFAGFRRFTETQINFVKEISVIIARTVFNIKVNKRTALLLDESRQMGRELQTRQEALRQNAEEMSATQEELKRINKRLEEQILEVNRSQKRTQLLLENASEVIIIYERDGKIRYISPSVRPILGYDPQELIGRNDLELLAPDNQDQVHKMFTELVKGEKTKATLELLYKKKDGNFVWLEATATNMLKDPAVNGIVMNSRDITERRRAETESRMRGQMQSLSENSTDLIARLDLNGQVYYMNPMIGRLVGKTPDKLIGKNVRDSEISGKVLDSWDRILRLVTEKKQSVREEIEFPSQIGERIMQVSAIPEFDLQERLETVLIVSHDITERKRIEVALLSTNRKITESINYAQRIQSAILPDEEHLQKICPDSFIYYKPRDVVSGDFPWIHLSKSGFLFVAAVDCTGHGVPGALISVIGYFILSNIASRVGEQDTGTVLNMLNEGVTETLRQDDGSKTLDGMDIALCKLNLKSKELQYSGAHRPLYLVRDGKLQQYKGNRFPIGAARIYRGKIDLNFTSETIQTRSGDALYIFSDGITDQFGGSNDKKFSSARLRNILTENADKSMENVRLSLDKGFLEWKDDKKQTDDVLVIGIKI